MNTRAYKPMHLRLLLAGIGGILASGIAIASLAISVRGSNPAATAAELPEAAEVGSIPAPRSSSHRCKECGVIESARKIEIPHELIRVHALGGIAAGQRGEIDGKPGRYLITIRLQDGSTRVITDANSAKWRPGERVSLIGGIE